MRGQILFKNTVHVHITSENTNARQKARGKIRKKRQGGFSAAELFHRTHSISSLALKVATDVRLCFERFYCCTLN